MKKVRWGVLGAAKIAVEKVIPAMQTGACSEVVAIASRDMAKAERAADALGLARAHGSYEALIADPEVDAIYNPLPNHLHVPLTRAAAEAGKHVLCEKPLALSAQGVRELIDVRDRTGVKMQEAFMVWTAPQWRRAVDICRSGRLGRIHSYSGFFSYFNDDPANIRNKVEWGGGGLMDIGCYLIVTAQMIFNEVPTRVIALVGRDSESGVDTLTSMMLDFPSGQAIGTCGTRLVAHQRVEVFGSSGRLEVEIPFNAPIDRPCRLLVDEVGNVFGRGVKTLEVSTCDQYRVQGDEFSRAILDDADVAYPLERSLTNMTIIDAAFRSAQSGRWETI